MSRCCVSGACAALVQRHGQAVRPLRIASAAQQRTEHVLFRNLDREHTGSGIFGRAEDRAAVIARLLPRGGDVFDGDCQSFHGTSYPAFVSASSRDHPFSPNQASSNGFEQTDVMSATVRKCEAVWPGSMPIRRLARVMAVCKTEQRSIVMKRTVWRSGKAVSSTENGAHHDAPPT